LAVPHPCFEVVEQEQGLPIHVDIDAAIAIAIGAGSDLNALQQVIELCRPFNDGVLAQWHGCAGAWMILQGLQLSKPRPCVAVPYRQLCEIAGQVFTRACDWSIAPMKKGRAQSYDRVRDPPARSCPHG
jgi:hypothetical protein